jgi:hypothetical protein
MSLGQEAERVESATDGRLTVTTIARTQCQVTRTVLPKARNIPGIGESARFRDADLQATGNLTNGIISMSELAQRMESNRLLCALGDPNHVVFQKAKGPAEMLRQTQDCEQ